ncbi:MAG TPA: tannase/feruloyl esterase family alpha/beta hydrolase [Terracidiphilus sp.]|nr:tannase/feruloyl esterase family alpha/beta hydrolase [Terracidiphilus sp.]HEV2400650.1 tannase/feruloyl esterase family alpha/beta hydrolase [Candidatus Sulfotelmatobacter sp.]
MKRAVLFEGRWAFFCVLLLPAVAGAQNSSSTVSVDSCAALERLNLTDVPGGPAIVTSARMVDVPGGIRRTTSYPSGYTPEYPSGYSDGTSHRSSEIRQYCDVAGYAAPQNKFELKLPNLHDWNGNLFFYACGGFCGEVLPEFLDLGLMRGYASVTGNGGHESSAGFDGIWAANAPELQEDFGWRSTHVVTLIAKAITAHYYGRPIRHAYIVGNSKGGQAVFMEAQRFPEDFVGYMPSAPVYDYTGRNVMASVWFWQAIHDDHGGSVLDAAAANAVHQSVLRLCGAQAGVDEGVVADPPSCKWQAEMVACEPGAGGPGCLNARQVAAVKKLMSPATSSKGEVVYAYPYIPGTETQWAGWNYYGLTRPGRPPRLANAELPIQFERYFIDEKMRNIGDPLQFNFDREPATFARSRRVYDALSVDLRAVKDRGGKILLWHGWADGAISATSSIGYYEAVMKFMGGRKETEDFFRLFLIPGVHHGGLGPGFTEFDSFTALENWVERGIAPDKLIASRERNGVIERSRPVYAYPIQARYTGKGDARQSESFEPFDASPK